MNKRIRYSSIGEGGVYNSNRVITTTQGEVKVRYNVNNMVVEIIDAYDENNVLRTFVAPNHQVMKRNIKLTLIEMGAVFGTETRTHAD